MGSSSEDGISFCIHEDGWTKEPLYYTSNSCPLKEKCPTRFPPPKPPGPIAVAVKALEFVANCGCILTREKLESTPTCCCYACVASRAIATIRAGRPAEEPACLRTLTPEEMAKVKPLSSEEIASALEAATRDWSLADGRPWEVITHTASAREKTQKVCKYLHRPGKRCVKCGHVEPADSTTRAIADTTVYGDRPGEAPKCCACGAVGYQLSTGVVLCTGGCKEAEAFCTCARPGEAKGAGDGMSDEAVCALSEGTASATPREVMALAREVWRARMRGHEPSTPTPSTRPGTGVELHVCDEGEACDCPGTGDAT